MMMRGTLAFLLGPLFVVQAGIASLRLAAGQEP